MRVLTVSPVPLWDVEDGKGMPSLFLGQRGYVDAGHEAVYAFAGREHRTYDYRGIRMEEFRVWSPIVPERYLLWHRLSMKLFWLAFLVVGTIQALRITRTSRVDVVYGHFAHGAPVAWLVGKMRGVPNVTRMFGTFLHPFVHSRWRRLRKLEEVLAYKVPCSYLIMTNDGTRGDDCAAVLGVPPERLKFWRNGIDRRAFSPGGSVSMAKQALGIPPDVSVLVAVSRLASWKRVDRLIEALPRVLARVPNTLALIVGDGEERGNLESLARKLGVADHVRFVGLVPHDDVPRFLAAADIFVSLYDLSNAGNPLLEALASGKCIVTLTNGATAEVNRDGEVAVLIKPERLDELPEVLIDLISDGDRRRDLGGRAAAYAQANLRTWAERTRIEVELIEDLVGARPPSNGTRVRSGARAGAGPGTETLEQDR